MNYCGIYKSDSCNGEGWRTVLFVSGCNHNCKNCQNPKTWDKNYGKEFTDEALNILIEQLQKPYIDGLTLSGGDPLFPDNKEEILRICKTIKTILPEKTIWLYTGYKYEEIKDLEIMNYIDVLVDGPFIEEQKDLTLAFRGSKNQRIIDVKTGNILNFDKKEEKND